MILSKDDEYIWEPGYKKIPERKLNIPGLHMIGRANFNKAWEALDTHYHECMEFVVVINGSQQYIVDGELCIIDVDDATLAEACGAKVNWRDDNVASVDEHNPVLKDLRDVDALHIPDPFNDGRIPEWLETTQRLRELVGKDVFIMGRADQGPFTLISLLRGTQNFMEDLLTEDEDVILHAVEWAVQAHTVFANAQKAVGADCTSMGDSYASPNLISPSLFRKYALPYEKEVVNPDRRIVSALSGLIIEY